MIPHFSFFDEPTIGLDVHAKKAFKDFLSNYPFGSEKTVLIATHDLTVIKDFCTRILLLDNGKLALDTENRCLKGKLGHKKLVIEFEKEPTENILETIMVFGYPVEKNENRLVIKVPHDEKERIEHIKEKLLMNATITSFRVEDMNYEETIEWLMGEFGARDQKTF